MQTEMAEMWSNAGSSVRKGLRRLGIEGNIKGDKDGKYNDRTEGGRKERY